MKQAKKQSQIILEKEEMSPFRQIARKLKMKKGAISKTELIASYMQEVKKDLAKYLGMEFADDMSMTTSNEDDDHCLAGESQSINSTDEMDIESFFQQFKTQAEESSATSKGGTAKE